MNTSIQFLGTMVMVLTVGSFFWAYKVTSSSVFQRQGGDRRASVRFKGCDRRYQVESDIWSSVEYWVHRTAWLLVAITSLIIFAVTFGSGI